MKKVLTILVVLTLIAGFAFAAEINHVTLSTAVAGIDPVFKLTHEDGTDGTKTLTNTSIAEESIEASFVVKQNNAIVNGSSVGYSNHGVAAGTAVSLTVTCGNFKNIETNETSAKVAVISAATYVDVIANNTDKLTYGTAPVNGSNSVVFVPTYHGKRVDNQDIGTFTATWAQDNTLSAGTYEADITLAYTAN